MIVALLLIASTFAQGRPDDASWVDSPSGHVRCHYEREEDAPLCDDVAGWADDAWAAQVDDLGFHPPFPDAGLGGSDALDVYLTRDAGGAGVAWVDCDGGDPNCVDLDPTDGLAGTSSYIIMDPRTDAVDLPHFVHHEFNHALQYATDYAEPYLCLWEGTAVGAERWTDPTWTTIASDLGDYQDYPWVSAILQDSYWLWEDFQINSWYEYGAVVWVFWMDDRYGDGEGSIGPELWSRATQEGASPDPDVLDAWDALSGGWRDDMLAFAADRALLGTSAGADWADFAGDRALARRSPSPQIPGTFSPGHAPYPQGTVYFDVDAQAGETLDLDLEGDAVEWGLVAVGDGVDAHARGTTLGVFVPAAGAVTVGVINLGPAGFVAGDALEPADFTLSISSDVRGGCGCDGSGAAGMGPMTLLALLGGLCRRIRREDGAPEKNRVSRPSSPPLTLR